MNDLRQKLIEGTEVLRTGGGASVMASECHVLLDALDDYENAKGLLAHLASVKAALRELVDYGPLPGTKRWNAMDSGERMALLRARELVGSFEDEA